MNKQLLVPALVCLAAAPVYSQTSNPFANQGKEWLLIGQNGKVSVFMNLLSLTPEGDHIAVSVRVYDGDRIHVQKWGYKDQGTRYRCLAYAQYDRKTGNFIRNFDVDGEMWQPVIPDSMAETGIKVIRAFINEVLKQKEQESSAPRI